LRVLKSSGHNVLCFSTGETIADLVSQYSLQHCTATATALLTLLTAQMLSTVHSTCSVLYSVYSAQVQSTLHPRVPVFVQYIVKQHIHCSAMCTHYTAPAVYFTTAPAVYFTMCAQVQCKVHLRAVHCAGTEYKTPDRIRTVNRTHRLLAFPARVCKMPGRLEHWGDRL